MPLLIATRNPAKLDRYRRALAQFPSLTVLSLQEAGLNLAVAEDGISAAENARLKAEVCAAAADMPALGVDEALFIPALPADQQPGVLVRRRGGRSLPDDELLAVFLELTRGLAPERRAVQWVFAMCLALPGGRVFEDQVCWSAQLSDRPCLPYQPGYPLSAVLIDPAAGKPVNRLSEAEARKRDRPVSDAVARLVGAWLSADEDIHSGVKL